MKVGIYFWDQTPSAGGAYTFQSTLVAAVKDLADYTSHAFTVFCGAEIAGGSGGGNAAGSVKFVVLPLPTFLQRATAALQRDAPLVRKIMPRQNFLERAFLDDDIELVWFVEGAPSYAIDIPYIATVWDLMHLTHPWFPEVSARGEWTKRELARGEYLKRAAAIITGTHAGKREIECFYGVPPERIHLLPHPTPVLKGMSPEVDEMVLARYGVTGQFLLYPAQFWPHKNHVALVRALKCLQDAKFPDFSVVFVGSDMGNREFVRRIAEEVGVADKVRFLGFVSTQDLVSLYRKAFALVYVSFCGPENLPPLEAFALGCPVVAADIPGSREQLGDCAWLVDPTRPQDIAGAITALAENQALRNALIQRGRQRALQWGGSDYAKGVLAILDRFAPIRSAWST